jgi:hypothetical protein
MKMPAPRSFEKAASLLCCLILGGAIALPAAGAKEESFEGSAGIGFRNQYNFRGFKAGERAPEISVEFSVPVSASRGLALDVIAWYVDPVKDDNDEFGLSTLLVVPVGDFHFKVGGIFFAFPEADWVTGEFGAGVSYSAAEYIDLELAWWSDVKGDGFLEDELRFGHYIEFNLGTSFELKNWLGVEVAAGISYGIDYYGSDGWNHAFAIVHFPIGISETVALTPHVGGTLALGGLEDAGEDDQFLTGIRLSVGF